MRVIYWSSLFWPEIGGLETLSRKLLPVLREHGHEIVIVASSGARSSPGTSEVDGFVVHRYPFLQALSNHDLKMIREIIEDVTAVVDEFSPDLVHLNELSTSFYLLKIIGKLDVPLLTSIHSDVNMATNEEGILLRALSSSHTITAVSSAILKDAIRKFPVIKPKSILIHNGLKAPDILPAPVDFDPPRFLCFARLTPQKGVDVAIRAFSLLREKMPEAQLTIAGDGVSKRELEQLAGELGQSGHITFLGWVDPDQIYPLINRHSVVIIPSRYEEPFGLVALEASHMERPIVVSRVGALPEIILEGKTGYVFEKEDFADLASKMERLIQHPQEARQMGKAARKRALQHFGFEKMAQAYADLYKKMEQSISSRRREGGSSPT